MIWKILETDGKLLISLVRTRLVGVQGPQIPACGELVHRRKIAVFLFETASDDKNLYLGVK
jgi:hypothetical protein